MPGGFEKKELRLEVWDSILATAGRTVLKENFRKKEIEE